MKLIVDVNPYLNYNYRTMDEINNKIQQLNQMGIPVIFIITGNNCAGKTTYTKKLIQNFNFYQTINLGIISKMIRFFRADIQASALENFDGNESSVIFQELVDFIIESYIKTGVNIIIEGVQINTERLFSHQGVLGGIILDVKQELAIRRGEKPETHFNRSISKDQLKHPEYVSNAKFKIVNNNKDAEQTFAKIMLHLNNLLDKKLQQL